MASMEILVRNSSATRDLRLRACLCMLERAAEAMMAMMTRQACCESLLALEKEERWVKRGSYYYETEVDSRGDGHERIVERMRLLHDVIVDVGLGR